MCQSSDEIVPFDGTKADVWRCLHNSEQLVMHCLYGLGCVYTGNLIKKLYFKPVYVRNHIHDLPTIVSSYVIVTYT